MSVLDLALALHDFMRCVEPLSLFHCAAFTELYVYLVLGPDLAGTMTYSYLWYPINPLVR